ncbi:MAG: DUF433 domain-containing protein [Candidatus Verstraetearchaeota archaeon]|nr:DUF433 domain-containing protein [Candidatus Verstraetearchaeota archaeon]
MEDWRSRITVDPEVLAGKPVIKGTRMAVDFIVELLANSWTIEEVLVNYPQLKREDVIATLKYAAEVSRKARPPA